MKWLNDEIATILNIDLKWSQDQKHEKAIPRKYKFVDQK